MPIVISYEDVEALGSLAFKGAEMGAEAQGQLQNRTLSAGIQADRDATAAQLQGISSRERIAQQQLAFQADQAGARQQLAYDTLDQRDALARADIDAALAETGIRAQADLQQELLGGVSQQARDERLHQQRLTEIDRRAAVSGGTGGVMGPGGVPDKKFATQEAQTHGNLIPYDTARAVSPQGAVRQQKISLETAQGLSALPTDQLVNYMASGRVQERWQPYVQAVIQARQQVSGGGVTGAMPNGRSAPDPRRSGSPSLREGRGLGDERYRGMSDAEFLQHANDPVMNRYLGAP